MSKLIHPNKKHANNIGYLIAWYVVGLRFDRVGRNTIEERIEAKELAQSFHDRHRIKPRKKAQTELFNS